MLVVLLATSLAVVDVSAGENLHRGTRVRVETGSTQLIGVVVDTDAEGLVIQADPQGPTTHVARDEILGLEAWRVHRHTVRGLLAGALAWLAVVGLYAAFDTLDESGVGEPLLIGGMIAAGGIVGSLIKTERWEHVPVSAVSARVLPRKRSVGLELVLSF
jgi:hypothetical protein